MKSRLPTEFLFLYRLEYVYASDDSVFDGCSCMRWPALYGLNSVSSGIEFCSGKEDVHSTTRYSLAVPTTPQESCGRRLLGNQTAGLHPFVACGVACSRQHLLLLLMGQVCLDSQEP